MSDARSLSSDQGQLPAQVLHLEDDPLDARLIAAHIEDAEIALELTWVKTSAELREQLALTGWDLVLLDYRLRGETGLEVLEDLAALPKSPPCIVLSGEIGEEYGVECIHAGAVDYVLKDRSARLVPAIQRALTAAREQARLKELESMLRQQERLESLGMLAGNVAHDFNNILAGILNLTESATACLATDHPARAYLHQTQRLGSRAASLTRRLLAYGRHQTLEPQEVDFNAMVEETAELFGCLAPPGLVVTHHFDDSLHTVQVDPGQLQHVILNLCINARDAMPGGGSLRLRTRRKVLPEGTPGLAPGPYAQLDVIDTGTGIEADLLESVFEPFFTTKGAAGTGLGLASAFGTVSQSGGDLRVKSVAGEGSTFSILLPEDPVGEAAQPRASESYRREQLLPTRVLQVLLADDDDLIRDLARDYLTGLGYDVKTAGTGAEALDLIETAQGSLDVLVADIVMPDLSGREIAKFARSRHPNCQIVYTSGYSRDSVFEGKLLDNGETFLQKPVRLATLASLLKENLA